MNVLSMLADMSPAERSKLLWALGALMGLVLVGFTAILLIRRRLKAVDDADQSGNVGFSLSDLRQMRDDGEITPEEYEATRAKVIAKVKQSFDRKPLKKPLPGLGKELPGELGGEAGTDFSDPSPPSA